MASQTDRIEKRIILRAPRARVWRAIADAKEFGAWFGATFTGAFAPGATMQGTITTKGYEGFKFEITVERMEPDRLLSFRWHPYAIDPNVDYSREPPTLVVFELEEVSGATQLKVVESGFDRIPAARRAEAFKRNEEGWGIQLKNIERYVTGAA
jgi:uncharacterized protein YndB with AHSA1/START domain